MLKYLLMFSISASSLLADDFPLCDALQLPNVTNFSVQEIQQAGAVQIQFTSGVALGLACGLSEKGDFVTFEDWGEGLYTAEPNPIHTSSSTNAKFLVLHVCKNPSSKTAEVVNQGFFNSIPQVNPANGRSVDYMVYDGKVSGFVETSENQPELLLIRDVDLNQRIIAVARRNNTQWEIENPGCLSPAHIGFVLTHKQNKKVACWGTVSSSSSDGAHSGGPGFLLSVGIAVGVTAAVTGLIAATVFATCKICEKCDQRHQYNRMHAQQPEMIEL